MPHSAATAVMTGRCSLSCSCVQGLGLTVNSEASDDDFGSTGQLEPKEPVRKVFATKQCLCCILEPGDGGGTAALTLHT